ncbi:NYN domain-containing protein, partial [Clostridioides difficile]|nr:NYN domain-containing protein [Clostridioides difficile]
MGEPSRRVPEVERGGPHLPLFRKRAAIYVDGFNLFHAIDDIQRP